MRFLEDITRFMVAWDIHNKVLVVIIGILFGLAFALTF